MTQFCRKVDVNIISQIDQLFIDKPLRPTKVIPEITALLHLNSCSPGVYAKPSQARVQYMWLLYIVVLGDRKKATLWRWFWLCNKGFELFWELDVSSIDCWNLRVLEGPAELEKSPSSPGMNQTKMYNPNRDESSIAFRASDLQIATPRVFSLQQWNGRLEWLHHLKLYTSFSKTSTKKTI